MNDKHLDDKKRKTIGVQFDEHTVEALINEAAEYGTTISGVIRMIILDYLKRYRKFGKGDNK